MPSVGFAGEDEDLGAFRSGRRQIQSKTQRRITRLVLAEVREVVVSENPKEIDLDRVVARIIKVG